MNGNTVQNDIRFAILDAFEREGIDIPSTPRAMPPERRSRNGRSTTRRPRPSSLEEERRREEAALAAARQPKRKGQGPQAATPISGPDAAAAIVA